MRNILVYLFPLLMDVIVSGIFFITAYRFSEANVAGWIVGGTMTAWALTYSAVSFCCGWFVKPANSHKIVIGAAAGITLVSLGFLIFDGLYTQFLWLMLTGIFGALFFTPFQVYMKRLAPDSGGAIVRSTAMYTGSWSLGFALGPLFFGLLSPRQGFMLCTAAGAVIALGVIIIESLPAPQPAEQPLPAASADSGKSSYAGFPDLVLTGYIVGGVGCIVISLLRTLGPFRGVSLLHFPRSEMSLVLSVVSFAQSLTAFLLLGSKTWMYRKIPGILLNAAGIGALLGFGFCTTVTGFMISAVFFGIYSGAFYFLLVFHSLVHPTKSARYLAGNETIVGATGIIAPVLGGALVTPESSGWAFIAGALLVLAALALQQWILFRHSKEIPL